MAYRIAYFTNIAPHYREALWLNILKDSKYNFKFYFSDSSRKGIKTIDFNNGEWKQYKTRLHSIKNVFLFGRLVFQFGVISQVLFNRWDAVILLGDSNILSNWVAALLLRAKGTPAIFWGHGMYGNESKLKKWFRLRFLKLAKGHLVYGHRAKDLLAREGFDKDKIFVIYNSLDYKKSCVLRKKVVEKKFFQKRGIFRDSSPVLIFIGRLTPQKRIDWLIEAVNKLNKEKFRVNLVIIGDGPERVSLEKQAEGENPIYFFGACYDEEQIAKFLANSDLCISPGNVGLTAIHSLSYGTPVCTHDQFENQMPEFEAIQEGITGCFFDFEKRNIAETVKHWFIKDHNRKEIREACYRKIDTSYNPRHQVGILNKTLKDFLS